MDASASAWKRTTQGPHSPSSTNKGAKHRAPAERVFHVQSMTTIHDSGVSNNENSNPNIISAPSIDSGTAHSSVTCGTAAKHEFLHWALLICLPEWFPTHRCRLQRPDNLLSFANRDRKRTQVKNQLHALLHRVLIAQDKVMCPDPGEEYTVVEPVY
ncbi:hypothetical protein ACET3Z_022169 [Daucus carota]